MNSLTYLSRQFDGLASAKTPPSTPTSSKSAFLELVDTSNDQPSSEPALKRVKTWSTRSLFFPPPRTKPPASNSPPKRSYSSPSEFTTLASLTQRKRPSSLATASTEPHLSQTRCPSSFQAVVRRIFFIRVFVMAWDALCSTWASFSARLRWWRNREFTVHIEILTSSNDGKGKETIVEDLSTPFLLSNQTPPTPSSTSPLAHPLSRHHTDPPALPDAQYTSSPHVTSPLSTQVHPSPPTPPSDAESASRSPTPVLTTRKPPFHRPKTLVLDLDETLIHSTSRPMPISGGSGFFGLSSLGKRNKGVGHTVEVVLGGKSTLYHVYKRPFVDFFLRTVSGWYTLVIFTASMQEYADPVIDWLDAGRGILGRRLFRDSCTQLPNGSYTKNLSIVEEDLSSVCLIDNSPISYRVNEANGIPIEGWTNDPADEALLDLLPVLDSLRFTSDVRRVLGLRNAGGNFTITTS